MVVTADQEKVMHGIQERSIFVKNVVPLNFVEVWVEIEVVATESANRANTSLENLDVTVRKFRERIKNDLSSMKASSDRGSRKCRR
ncbi:MAG: hypothetical protein IPK44_24610 [Candidatus Accumulibacter sp.]|uniref:hypothetical protein n=1 Tax=Accumulibacter sp. TaxID=2053492 RepID=UPI002589F020|nr:hypothetical protein [Accumulibacter sp.]MBK8117473.1 hypothetical protein [Accumulibacter sp.]